MTEKFDPIATPFCDRESRRSFVSWELVARYFEMDKRILEEKLRIALYFINNRREFFNAYGTSMANNVLKEIEQVGK